MPPKSLKICIAVIKTMRERNINYNEACKIVAKEKGKVPGTIRDSCTRFGKGKTNQLDVSEVERQVESGEIVNTLKRRFPDHLKYINRHLGE